MESATHTHVGAGGRQAPPPPPMDAKAPGHRYQVAWGKVARPWIEKAWQLDGGVVSSTLELVTHLMEWEDSKAWDCFDSFGQAIRTIGIRSITYEMYGSLRRTLELYDRTHVMTVGLWGAEVICRAPRAHGIKEKVRQRVHRWVKEHGRPPSRVTARDLLREVYPRAVGAGTKDPLQVQMARMREEYEARIKDMQAKHEVQVKDLRQQLRDCHAARVLLARENGQLRKKRGKQ